MSDSPSILVRGIWFVAVGWWLTGVLLTTAWILNITIVGLPIGIKIVNYVPKALTLKSSEGPAEDHLEIGGSNTGSPSLIVRAMYFVLIGWWASALWTVVAYLLCLTVLGLPFGVKMFNKLPKVVSLYNG